MKTTGSIITATAILLSTVGISQTQDKAVSESSLTFENLQQLRKEWGPFVGPWNRYNKNPIIRLEGKEADFDGIYLQHACPILVDGQWRLYYNGWTLNPKAKNEIGAEYAIGVAVTK